MGTGLSRILHRGIAHTHLHNGYSDMLLRVEDALRITRGARCYVGIYWPALDTIAHAYGAHNRYTHTEIRTQLAALRDLQRNTEEAQALANAEAVEGERAEPSRDRQQDDAPLDVRTNEHPKSAPRPFVLRPGRNPLDTRELLIVHDHD